MVVELGESLTRTRRRWAIGADGLDVSPVDPTGTGRVVRRWRIAAVLALLTVAGCASLSDSDVTSSTAPATADATTTTARSTLATSAPTAAPAMSTDASTAASTTAFPTTTAQSAPPSSAAPPPSAPPWERSFEDAAQQPGNTVVWADNPGGLAVGRPGQWLLVDTATDQTVQAAINAPVIGVRPVNGGTFGVVTVQPDGNAALLAVTNDGRVDSLGPVPVDTASPSVGVVPVYASIAPAGDTVYVAVATAVQAGFPFKGSFASATGGATHPLPDPPGYGPVTFTDSGAMVITVPSDLRVAGPALNRWISSDGGATWQSIAIPSGGFATTGILLGISNTSALAFDRAAPSRLGVVDATGAVSGEFDIDGETDGWLVAAMPDDPHATLVGAMSGTAITVDRATGAPTGPARAQFTGAHGLIVDAWTGSDGEVHALAYASGCSGTCQPTLVLDGVPGGTGPPAGLAECTWRATFKDNDGGIGHQFTALSLTNIADQPCPVPHIAAVTGFTNDGHSITSKPGKRCR